MDWNATFFLLSIFSFLGGIVATSIAGILYQKNESPQKPLGIAIVLFFACSIFAGLATKP